MKKHLLVCYDYGMGGLWAVFNARSAAEVSGKYPMLTAYEEWPAWVTQEFYDRFAAVNLFDIDERLHGVWLDIVSSESK